MGEYPLSDTYVLDMIDQMDLKHATGIISFMVQFTELEFNVDDGADGEERVDTQG